MGVIAEMVPILLQILAEAPAAVKGVEEAWKLLTTKEQPTTDQQAQIDAALEDAHRALQAS